MPARGQARESAGRQRSANGELAVRLKQKVLSDRDLPWGGYGQGELAQAGAHRVYQDPAKLTRHIDDLGVRFRVQERLEITDSECRPQCAQTVLDTADLVTDGDVTTTITNGRGGIQLYERLSHNKSDGVKSNMSTG